MFLEQYWGGPKAYGERRGHPRLRMRHAPFPVSPAAKDAWLRHMNAALDEVALAPMHDAAMRDYFERAAHSMINTHDGGEADRKSTRLNSSHVANSYAVFCLKIKITWAHQDPADKERLPIGK